MPTFSRYVLIDFENVQPKGLETLNADGVKVLVFVGANQKKLEFATANALQRLGDRAEYIPISGSGSNALDFHVAFYAGQFVATDPGAAIWIISKDKGFDPLIQHLKSRGITAKRVADVGGIVAPKPAKSKASDAKQPAPAPKAPASRLDVVLSNLRARGASRPRTLKTLAGTVRGMFQKTPLAAGELEALLADLQARGFVAADGQKVTYKLPE
jgi:hypothetical protein